jgi:hypothetical protein
VQERTTPSERSFEKSDIFLSNVRCDLLQSVLCGLRWRMSLRTQRLGLGAGVPGEGRLAVAHAVHGTVTMKSAALARAISLARHRPFLASEPHLFHEVPWHDRATLVTNGSSVC